VVNLNRQSMVNLVAVSTTSTKWRFPLEGILPGKNYQAIIVADGSGEDVFGLEYLIKL
jgi:hypothetical protein